MPHILLRRPLALALILMVVLPSPWSHAASDCEPFLNKSSLVQSDISPIYFKPFPEWGTPGFKSMVKAVKRQLEANGSFAILDLSSFMPDGLGEAWFHSLPHHVPSLLYRGEVLYSEKGHQMVQPASSWQTKEVTRLQNFLRDVIREATDESIPFSPEENAQVRLLTKEAQAGVRSDNWHLDGGRASVTFAVYGQGTEVLGPAPMGWSFEKYHGLDWVGDKWEKECPSCKALTVSAGKALIFFGSQSGMDKRFHPTVHRTPIAAGDRVLFVFRY